MPSKRHEHSRNLIKLSVERTKRPLVNVVQIKSYVQMRLRFRC